MGVKELWRILSPVGEVQSLAEFAGCAVAVDLSCWICDSQNVNMGHIAKPHLRNLFFRSVSLLNAGILPVFIFDGEAPAMKWDMIECRIQRTSKCASRRLQQTTDKQIHKGKRSRLKGLINQCQELLDLLGLPWVQADGEADATCAAMYYHKKVDAIISQDSDIFLYGGDSVLRNFTASRNKGTVEAFRMKKISDLLHLDREAMICLAILLGCDYLPAGIPGIGKETALQLLSVWRKAGYIQCLKRLFSWREESWNSDAHLLSTVKCRALVDVEANVRRKALATPGFPFSELISEFKKILTVPSKKLQWSSPKFVDLILWCQKHLEWDAGYALEKVTPVVTRWSLVHSLSKGLVGSPSLPINCQGLTDPTIVRKCVRHGVACCEVRWKLEKTGILLASAVATYSVVTTLEPLDLIATALPQTLQEFEDRSTKKSQPKRKTVHNRDNIQTVEEKVEAKLHLGTHFRDRQLAYKEVALTRYQKSFAWSDGSDEEVSFIIDMFHGLKIKTKDEDRLGTHKKAFVKRNSTNNKDYKCHLSDACWHPQPVFSVITDISSEQEEKNDDLTSGPSKPHGRVIEKLKFLSTDPIKSQSSEGDEIATGHDVIEISSDSDSSPGGHRSSVSKTHGYCLAVTSNHMNRSDTVAAYLPNESVNQIPKASFASFQQNLSGSDSDLSGVPLGGLHSAVSTSSLAGSYAFSGTKQRLKQSFSCSDLQHNLAANEPNVSKDIFDDSTFYNSDLCQSLSPVNSESNMHFNEKSLLSVATRTSADGYQLHHSTPHTKYPIASVRRFMSKHPMPSVVKSAPIGLSTGESDIIKTDEEQSVLITQLASDSSPSSKIQGQKLFQKGQHYGSSGRNCSIVAASSVIQQDTLSPQKDQRPFLIHQRFPQFQSPSEISLSLAERLKKRGNMPQISKLLNRLGH